MLPAKALPDGSAGPNLYCTVIVKRVGEKTREGFLRMLSAGSSVPPRA